MTESEAGPAPIRRPGLLVRAARAGLRGYRRDPHLAELLPAADPERDPGGTLARLREIERGCEAARRAGAAEYSPAWHVSILAALLAETRALAAGPG